MTARRRRLWDTTPNRCMDDVETAIYCGYGPETFKKVRPAWEREGFPQKDPVTKRTDREVVDRWFDARAGLVQLSPVEQADEALERWATSKSGI